MLSKEMVLSYVYSTWDCVFLYILYFQTFYMSAALLAQTQREKASGSGSSVVVLK